MASDVKTHLGGDLMDGPSETIYVSGPFARFCHNRIDRTGNVGLYLRLEARSRDVASNYIRHSGLALSDTGGIYTAEVRDGPEQDQI